MPVPLHKGLSLKCEHRTSVEFKIRTYVSLFSDFIREHRTSVEFKQIFRIDNYIIWKSEHRTSVEFKHGKNYTVFAVLVSRFVG